MSDNILEQALKSKLPFIHVTTTDLLYISEVLSYISGESVYPLQQNADGSLGSLKHDIYYTSAELVTPATYLEFKTQGKCLVFVNTKPSVLHFTGGVMLPPRGMMLNYLRDLMEDAENAEDALPAFSGMTLKEMYEATRLTLHRAGKVTAREINDTRRGYISKLKGLVQVDTKYDFYQCPSYLEDWMSTNSTFFTKPVLPSLTPRGLLLDGPPGCLDGDTLVSYNRGKREGGRSMALKDLYLRFNGLPCGRNPPRLKNAPTYLQSMQLDGSIIYNRIISIIESGVKPCITLKTEKGNALTLTLDHPICNQAGDFLPSSSFKIGDVIRIRGSMRPTGDEGRKPRTVHRKEQCVNFHPVAGIKVVNGCTYKRMNYSRFVIEAHMNKLPIEEYLFKLNNNLLEGLKFLDPSQEVHHLDENVKNDTLSNLVVMLHKEHARHHGKLKNVGNFKTEYSIDDTIVSISSAGDRMTYDVQMDMPCHNFVANNFIVHNTGKTAAAKFIASEWGIPLYHLDIGALKDKYVGGSEAGLNAALSQIDSLFPAVLLLDEAEKAFSSQSDSGVTSSLLGTLLWWLQEHESRVFTVMTTNCKESIPKELYREGRIDAVMVFQGLESQSDAEYFGVSVYNNLSKQLWGDVKPIPTKIEKDFKARLKIMFSGGAAVPQVAIVKEVQAMVKRMVKEGVVK